MSDTNLQIIKKYLDNYGWEYTQKSERELILRFLGEESNTEFNLIITLDQHWVGLTIWPYLLPFPKKIEYSAIKSLCKWNFQTKLVRLGISENGETSMCLDLPLENLNEGLFHLGLDLISYYADMLYPEFVTLWSENN